MKTRFSATIVNLLNTIPLKTWVMIKVLSIIWISLFLITQFYLYQYCYFIELEHAKFWQIQKNNLTNLSYLKPIDFKLFYDNSFFQQMLIRFSDEDLIKSEYQFEVDVNKIGRIVLIAGAISCETYFGFYVPYITNLPRA